MAADLDFRQDSAFQPGHRGVLAPGPGRSELRHGIAAVLTARRLIVTVPVSLLQSGSIDIQPAMPTWKQLAPSIPWKCAVVVPMLFEERFWEDQIPGPGVRFSPADRKSMYVPHTPEQAALQRGLVPGPCRPELEGPGSGSRPQRVLGLLSTASGKRKLREKLRWSHFEDWARIPAAWAPTR